MRENGSPKSSLPVFRAIEFSLLGLFFLFLLGIAISRVHSFDIFWQLQSGRYMLETGSFIRNDIFTLAADAKRLEHCWLHDLIFFLAYRFAGYAGLSLLKGGLLVATAAALVAAARLRGASLLAIMAVLPTAFLLTRGAWLERPQLWTFLFFALFILILERYRRQAGRLVFFLPVLMLFWMNLHGGAVLAFALLAAYIVGGGVDIGLQRSNLPWKALGSLFFLALLTGVASLVTPYYSPFFANLKKVASLGAQADAAGQISGPLWAVRNMDWRPTTFATDPAFFFLLGVVALVLLAGWRRLSASDLCLLAGLALMGLRLGRHTTFLFLAAIAILPVYLDAALRPVVRWLNDRWLAVSRSLTLVALVGAAAFFSWPAVQVYGWFEMGLREWHYPLKATEFIRSEKLPANLYNTYDWGGYLAWQLFPDYKVFWDGRQDSADMFRQGWLVMAGKPEWAEILERFQVKTIVTRSATIDTGQHFPLLDRLRESADWELVFADDVSLVFVRREAVEAGWLTARRLEKSRVDDTILKTAELMTAVNPGRYMAWWEIARIRIDRRQFKEAFQALERHLQYAPEGKHLPAAENYYRILYPMMRQG